MRMEKLLISACLLGVPCRYDGKSVPLREETLRKLRERFDLLPVCPESDGGLPTPRIPSERQGERVRNREGEDVTEAYRRGARLALEKAQSEGCTLALLKERSPSCGSSGIYDGSFTARLIPGLGVTAELLLQAGIRVYGESEIEALFHEPEQENTIDRERAQQ